MKRTITLAAVIILFAAAAHAEIRGTWTAFQKDDGRIQLDITRPHNHFGSSFLISDFSNLAMSQRRDQ